jgi:hypothetical protein
MEMFVRVSQLAGYPPHYGRYPEVSVVPFLCENYSGFKGVVLSASCFFAPWQLA